MKAKTMLYGILIILAGIFGVCYYYIGDAKYVMTTCMPVFIVAGITVFAVVIIFSSGGEKKSRASPGRNKKRR